MLRIHPVHPQTTQTTQKAQAEYPRLARDPRTEAIIGCALEVHHALGAGFLERVYQSAFERELVRQGITYKREVDFLIRYKGELLDCAYRADFVCSDILVELKAQSALGGADHAQVLNYLKASGLGLGLLLNFGTTRLEVKRLAM